jgi:hypothetical protein
MDTAEEVEASTKACFEDVKTTAPVLTESTRQIVTLNKNVIGFFTTTLGIEVNIIKLTVKGGSITPFHSVLYPRTDC